MKKLENFSKGMGIGGWLTNYKRFNVLPDKWRMPITQGDMEHFETYITEADAINIKNMGLDHVRIGFDQIVMEESPYVYREKTFEYLHNFVEACERQGLRVILNMHKAIGNYCDIKEDVTLFDSQELQNRFIAMWVEFEKRYADKQEVMFELLNEVRNIDPELWNDLADRTIKAIREINPTRKIIVGSICWNRQECLKDLRVWDDENIIYTFHMYDPHMFTHQRGVLQSGWLYANMALPYPTDDVERYRTVQRIVSGNPEQVCFAGDKRIDRDHLKKLLLPAKEFADAHPDKILWCGEFGTIRHCKMEYRENWMEDVISILNEWDMPYSVWNYLSTPNDGNRFSLVDDDTREILSERMLKIINGTL